MNRGGLDDLAIALVQKAAQDILERIMQGKRGRKAYVLVVVADGPHAAKVFAHSPMTNTIAFQFADAIEHEADQVREKAQRGLMATAQAVAEKRRIQGG